MRFRDIENYKKNILLVAMLVLFGSVGRYILVGWYIQPFPNFEVITVTAFLGVMLLRSSVGIFVAPISIFLSDLMLGNPIMGEGMYRITVFTYSGFTILAVVSMLLKNPIKNRLMRITPGSVALAAGLGIGFALIYDLWTNLGWWYLLYPHTLSTLLTVYALGVPFMAYHIASGVFTFVAIGLPTMVLICSIRTNKVDIWQKIERSTKALFPTN
jgi:hypothetical protein